MVFESKKANNVNNEKIDVSNSYGRKFQVSPLFPFSNSATISASTSSPNNVFLIDFELDNPDGYASASAFKYAPFNNLRIVNNSGADVIIYPNQRREQGILVAKGTSQNIDNQAVKGFSSVLIENIDTGDITAKQLRVLLWKDNVNTDSILKRMHNTLFNGSA